MAGLGDRKIQGCCGHHQKITTILLRQARFGVIVLTSTKEIDMEMFVLLVILAVVYFAQTIIAVRGDHKNQGAIAVLNPLLGWTFLGWVAAMVWSVAE